MKNKTYNYQKTHLSWTSLSFSCAIANQSMPHTAISQICPTTLSSFTNTTRTSLSRANSEMIDIVINRVRMDECRTIIRGTSETIHLDSIESEPVRRESEKRKREEKARGESERRKKKKKKKSQKKKGNKIYFFIFVRKNTFEKKKHI